MTTPDPVRWLDQPDQALSDAAQESLRAYAEHGPSAAAHARMWSQLETAALTPGAGPVAAARARWWWWIGTGIVGVVALWLTLQSPSDPQAPAARVASAPSRPVVAAPAQAEPPSAPAPPETPAAPPSEPAQRASAPARVRGPAAKPAPATLAPAPESAGDPTAELALLTPARQLLAARPQRSLELADEHARLFPRGVFAEERAFLRIEALLRLDQAEQAQRDARAFRRGHPRSTYLERLDALLP